MVSKVLQLCCAELMRHAALCCIERMIQPVCLHSTTPQCVEPAELFSTCVWRTLPSRAMCLRHVQLLRAPCPGLARVAPLLDRRCRPTLAIVHGWLCNSHQPVPSSREQLHRQLLCILWALAIGAPYCALHLCLALSGCCLPPSGCQRWLWKLVGWPGCWVQASVLGVAGVCCWSMPWERDAYQAALLCMHMLFPSRC